MRLSWLMLFLLSAVSPLARAEEGQSEKKESTIEEFLQSLSTVQGVIDRHDPFAEHSPPFEIIQTSSGPIEDPFASTPGAPVLERYAVPDYEVVAVLLGDKYPRALMRLPADAGNKGQKVVIVKEGDKLGNRKGVISKITSEGVIVQQAQRSVHGFVDKVEVLLKVGGKLEDQRRTLIASKPAESGEKPKNK